MIKRLYSFRLWWAKQSELLKAIINFSAVVVLFLLYLVLRAIFDVVLALWLANVVAFGLSVLLHSVYMDWLTTGKVEHFKQVLKGKSKEIADTRNKTNIENIIDRS